MTEHKKVERTIELREIKLSPEVVEARKLKREAELNKPFEQRVQEIREAREEERKRILKQVLKENGKEIFFTYLAIFGIIIGGVILGSLLGH